VFAVSQYGGTPGLPEGNFMQPVYQAIGGQSVAQTLTTSDDRALETLAQGYSGRLATVSEDNFPYCIPPLYL
jgi:hypothetical protein